jgi:hypothetical protein
MFNDPMVVVYHQIDVFQNGNGFHNRLNDKKSRGITLKVYGHNTIFTSSDLFEFGGVISFIFFLKLYFKGLRNYHFQDSRFRYHISKFSFSYKIGDFIRACYFFILENFYSFFANIIFINKADGFHIINKSNLFIDCPINGNFEIRRSLVGDVRVVFVGNFEYEPNVKCLYALRNYKLDFDFHVYGYNTELIDKKLLNNRIMIHGPVQDFSYLGDNAIFFNFVCYGSGFKNKLTHCIRFNIPLIGMNEALNGSEVLEGSDYVNYSTLRNAINFINKLVLENQIEYILKLRI